MLVSKSNITKDQKWRDSFKKMHTHRCWITGQEFTEYSSYSITGCHITIGRYGKGLKDDQYIIPLRQDLHLEMDKNQEQFIIRNFDKFPLERRENAIKAIKERKKGWVNVHTAMISHDEIIKQMAKDYYHEWLDKKLWFQN